MRRREVLIFGLLFAAPAFAAPPDALRDVETQMNQNQQEQEKLDADAREAGKNIDELRQKLIQSTQRIQDKEAEEENLEDRLDDLAEQIAERSKNSVQERARLQQMAAALIEISSRPPITLFMQNKNTSDHIHRSLLLRAVLPRLRDEAEIAARDLASLVDLQVQMGEQKRLVAAARENLAKQRQDMDQLIAARQGFLQRTEQQKAEIAAHLAELSAQAKDLRQLMERVAPPQSAPRAASAGTVSLKWPAAGAIRRRFGEKDADGVISEGVTIASLSGAPVVAPHAGKVVFAGPFRGYGQIMILQHVNGYHSFLAGFGRIDAEMGQEVAAGEPLGVLPVKAGTKPELYFEWRRGEKPIDPAMGLGSGSIDFKGSARTKPLPG